MTTRPEPADRGRWLLWPAGLAAAAVGVAALLLWGLNGAGYAFDLLVAYCL